MKKLQIIVLFLMFFSIKTFAQDSSQDRWIDSGNDTNINIPTDGELKITKNDGNVWQNILSLKLNSSANDYFRVRNATSVTGDFVPWIIGNNQSSRPSLIISGVVDYLSDVAGDPVLLFDSRAYQTPTTLTNGRKINTRNLFDWRSFDQIYMTMSASGRLGIGSTSPSAQLHTTSTVRFQGLSNLLQSNLIMADVNGNLSKYQIPTNTTLGFISSTASTDALPRFDASKNLINSQIFDNGTNIGIGGLPATNAKVTVYGVVNTLSDINEKKNIVHLENAMEIVNQLNGYNYEWKNSDEKQIGLIAQEVEKVLPEAVSQNENGTKFLNYDGIIPVLTEALKEQQKVIKTQNDRINLLFEEIEKLKKLKK